MKTVALKDGTVGTTNDSAEEGQHVTVSLGDENGMPITATGTVTHILEDDPWCYDSEEEANISSLR